MGFFGHANEFWVPSMFWGGGKGLQYLMEGSMLKEQKEKFAAMMGLAEKRDLKVETSSY